MVTLLFPHSVRGQLVVLNPVFFFVLFSRSLFNLLIAVSKGQTAENFRSNCSQRYFEPSRLPYAVLFIMQKENSTTYMFVCLTLRLPIIIGVNTFFSLPFPPPGLAFPSSEDC